jgi:glycine cleavage system regulatory protein
MPRSLVEELTGLFAAAGHTIETLETVRTRAGQLLTS